MGATLTSSDPLFDFLLRMGDNCLILAHRTSQWCGHAPALEEDIALANVSLDLIGQTQLWLGLAGEVEAKGRSADDLAYLRDAYDFRNVLMVEQPNGDFGHTLMRQFLFDAWHHPMLIHLMQSSDKRIADIAEKASKEVAYHLERSSDLVIRLGDGSETSHAYMQNALDDLWSYCGEMLEVDDNEASLTDNGVIPDVKELSDIWMERVSSDLSAAQLVKPTSTYMRSGGSKGVHSEHLGFILAQMQFLQRAYPGAQW